MPQELNKVLSPHITEARAMKDTHSPRSKRLDAVVERGLHPDDIGFKKVLAFL
jgi:hypothetical protein